MDFDAVRYGRPGNRRIQTILSLYESGHMSRADAERLIAPPVFMTVRADEDWEEFADWDERFNEWLRSQT